MTAARSAAMGIDDADSRQRADVDLSSEPLDPDELALLAAGCPAFRLWRATVYDRICYVA